MQLLSRRSRYVKNIILETENRAQELISQGRKVVKLNRGDPPHYFPTPKYIIDAYIDALKEGKTFYSKAAGEKELKDAVIGRYGRMYGAQLNEEDVIITAGVSEALLFINNMLLDPGDKAVLFRPYYAQYIPRVEVEGGRVVVGRYEMESGWKLDLDGLERKLKKTGSNKGRIKYMMITNPHNPTGNVLRRKELSRLADIANENGIVLVSDEIYDEIVYNGAKFTSMAEVAKGIPHIILNGVSKNYLSTGFRVGFMVVPGEDKASAVLKKKLADYALLRLCINTPAQFAAAEAMNNTKEHGKSVKYIVKEISKRVNYAVMMLRENEHISVVAPNGSFYLLPKLDFSRLDFKSDKEFVETALDDYGVQLTRGSGFGEPSHFRIVALPPVETLDYAIRQINRMCEEHSRGMKAMATAKRRAIEASAPSAI